MKLETEKYLIACRSAFRYAMIARLQGQIAESKILFPTTPNWRSWWKSFKDPQRGVFQPPMVVVTFETYGFQEHQNVGTMARSGVIVPRDHSVGIDLALYELKITGNITIIDRDAVSQLHLGLTMLHYLQAQAFSFKLRVEDLPVLLPCNIHTESKSLNINNGFVLEEGSESGDISSLPIPFYATMWTALKKPIKLVNEFHVKILDETTVVPVEAP